MLNPQPNLQPSGRLTVTTQRNPTTTGLPPGNPGSRLRDRPAPNRGRQSVAATRIAMRYLGTYYAFGLASCAKDPESATAWYRQAAVHGDAKGHKAAHAG